MDILTEAFNSLLPFALWLEKLGCTPDTAFSLSLILTAAILYCLGWGGKRVWKAYQVSKVSKDLAPFYTYLQVKNARSLFIPSMGQNNSPTRDDEPSFSSRFIVKKPLIPWFIKTAFNEKKGSDKYFLVLADSGMGKTTFLINLYVQYISFFNFYKKHKIKLLPFGEPDIKDKISELRKNSDVERNTILLLDAFDEYAGLRPPEMADGISDDERFRRCLDEIVDLTRNFRDVVITSRTQYFPGQEDQPYELKVKRFDEQGFHTLSKLYLSPFNSREVNRYLNKKYGYFALWNRKKKNNARVIVNSSYDLMVRPMLLAYIDLLADAKKTFTNAYQIYETLIEKWIWREADKRRHESSSREVFKNDLHRFSNLVALQIYKNQKSMGGLSIPKKDAEEICTQHVINLNGYEITGQSLLTRDAHHNWKFAHKSILEFFLAKKCSEAFSFAIGFEFFGLDMAKKFYEAIATEPITKYIKIVGGTFLLDNKFHVNVDDFFISKYLVTQAEYMKITGKENPSHFKVDVRNPVEKVSWFDAIEYCNILNRHAGYSMVYDEKGNFIDAKGSIVEDVTKIRGFRLPTEAEWEYAAGGGAMNRTAFSGTNSEDELGGYAWFANNSNKKTHPVGLKLPNRFGLFDMSGNVWEWCYDGYDAEFWRSHSNRTINHLVNYNGGGARVLRGGSWIDHARHCRVAYRDYGQPDYRGNGVGFRVVFIP